VNRAFRKLPIALLCALALAKTGPDAVNVRRLRADLDYLCSFRLAGRVSLSPEADEAARYIGGEFRKAGLARWED